MDALDEDTVSRDKEQDRQLRYRFMLSCVKQSVPFYYYRYVEILYFDGDSMQSRPCFNVDNIYISIYSTRNIIYKKRVSFNRQWRVYKQTVLLLLNYVDIEPLLV